MRSLDDHFPLWREMVATRWGLSNNQVKMDTQNTPYFCHWSGEISARPIFRDRFPPNGGDCKGNPLQGNLGWWNIIPFGQIDTPPFSRPSCLDSFLFQDEVVLLSPNGKTRSGEFFNRCFSNYTRVANLGKEVQAYRNGPSKCWIRDNWFLVMSYS